MQPRRALLTIGGAIPGSAQKRDAARITLERKIGCLPVVEGEKLVGIVTETDFVKLVADAKQAGRAACQGGEFR